jgi:hypothetical protein
VASGPAGDPEVVPGWIKDPEVPQAPRTVLEILLERPPRRDNPVALGSDIVDLEYQFNPGRRQPRGAGIRDCPPSCSDTDAAPLQRHIRIWVVASIVGKAETQDTGVEVNGGVKVVRENLEPHCEPHHQMVAYGRRTSSTAA